MVNAAITIVQPITDLCIFTARKRSLGQGNIFAPVCHSVHSGGGVPGQVPRDKVHPPGPGTPPGAVHTGRYGQQAGGTHHTGMHSCTNYYLTHKANLKPSMNFIGLT